MSEALSAARIASTPMPVSTAGLDSEVGSLLALATKKSRQGRADLFTAISDLFERRGDTLSEAERELMLDILRRLTGEVERAVRAELARRVSDNERVPQQLLTLLANDEIEVAYPILAQSVVLRDPDLIGGYPSPLDAAPACRRGAPRSVGAGDDRAGRHRQ